MEENELCSAYFSHFSKGKNIIQRFFGHLVGFYRISILVELFNAKGSLYLSIYLFIYFYNVLYRFH